MPSIHVHPMPSLVIRLAPLPSHLSESHVRKTPTADGMNNALNNRPSSDHRAAEVGQINCQLSGVQGHLHLKLNIKQLFSSDYRKQSLTSATTSVVQECQKAVRGMHGLIKCTSSSQPETAMTILGDGNAIE